MLLKVKSKKFYKIKSLDLIHNTSFSPQLTAGPNKLECHIHYAGERYKGKRSNLLGPFVCSKENKVSGANPVNFFGVF